jgi:hypothetical protein
MCPKIRLLFGIGWVKKCSKIRTKSARSVQKPGNGHNTVKNVRQTYSLDQHSVNIQQSVFKLTSNPL